MDPASLLVVSTLFMLLNGAVLGFVHRDLPRDVQASAADWRVGTLLVASGSILLAFQGGLPPEFMLPAANACLFAGAGLYWLSIRRFCGLLGHWAMSVPAVAGTAGIFWFAAIEPDHRMRVLIASPVWALYTLGAAWTLFRHGREHAGVSRTVLTVIFLGVVGIVSVRALHFWMVRDAPPTILASGAWISYASILVIAILPVIGTTAFILMCSERVRRQWERAAATDELTGLPNRRTISGTGQSRFNALARRPAGGLAVVVIDIDHFKSINDRHGHDIGDRALQHVAGLLDQHCRGPHLVGRQGGEEFVALLDVSGPEEAVVAAERLRARVESTPLPLASGPLAITASFGVGLAQPGDGSYEAVLKRADQALYRAKQSGRNRVEVCRDPAA